MCIGQMLSWSLVRASTWWKKTMVRKVLTCYFTIWSRIANEQLLWISILILSICPVHSVNELTDPSHRQTLTEALWVKEGEAHCPQCSKGKKWSLRTFRQWVVEPPHLLFLLPVLLTLPIEALPFSPLPIKNGVLLQVLPHTRPNSITPGACLQEEACVNRTYGIWSLPTQWGS